MWHTALVVVIDSLIGRDKLKKKRNSKLLAKEDLDKHYMKPQQLNYCMNTCEDSSVNIRSNRRITVMIASYK